MTNEEAIKRLSNRYMTASMCIDVNEAIKDNIALDMAITALRDAGIIKNCDGCKNDQCEYCMRNPQRPDMYEG